MSDEQTKQIAEIEVDPNNLYREETFTDLKIATLRRLVPVKPDGTPDDSREPLFMGQTQIMSQSGPVPVQAGIEAKTIEEAMEKFPAAIQQAVHRLVEEAREMQRQESSRIIQPSPTTSKIIS